MQKKRIYKNGIRMTDQWHCFKIKVVVLFRNGEANRSGDDRH